jgi:hypothetical protein
MIFQGVHNQISVLDRVILVSYRLVANILFFMIFKSNNLCDIAQTDQVNLHLADKVHICYLNVV